MLSHGWLLSLSWVLVTLSCGQSERQSRINSPSANWYRSVPRKCHVSECGNQGLWRCCSFINNSSLPLASHGRLLIVFRLSRRRRGALSEAAINQASAAQFPRHARSDFCRRAPGLSRGSWVGHRKSFLLFTADVADEQSFLAKKASHFVLLDPVLWELLHVAESNICWFCTTYVSAKDTSSSKFYPISGKNEAFSAEYVILSVYGIIFSSSQGRIQKKICQEGQSLHAESS